jgi:hypothetical protein
MKKLVSMLMLAAATTSLVVTAYAVECSYVDLEAGPIWNNEDAKTKCPPICTDHGGYWKGQWTTTVWGQMSVCGCYICP